MMRMLLDHPDFEKRDLSSLKTITIGGSAIPVNLIREIKRRTNCLFFNPYGATECAGSMTYINDQYYGRDASGQVSTRIESVGFPFLQCDVKVFDEEDKECLSRVIGEICVAGDNVMKGYLNMPEQTTAALKNGWYHTGDMGYLDEEGFLYIVDRKSDMIVSGGENIFPAEVEETINSIDGVYDVAVVGLPDQKWVESVTAFIVLKQGAVLTEEMVIDYCKNRIAGYKKPRKVYFVKEIPKNAAGKTLRRDLREQYSKKS
jgi:acyl-CoA synthetase (AMP-forming)/AMP-acid ligase II